MSSFAYVMLALLLLALVVVGMGVRTVPQGQRWTIERFGRFTRILNPGLNVIIPFFELVGRRMVVQERVLDISEQTVITQDNATITVDGILYYQVVDVERAAYGVQDLERALVTLAMTNIRSEIGSLTLDETLTGRAALNARIQAAMSKAATDWGIALNRVELSRIDPPENIVAAMTRQMTAERERRAAVAKATGEKEAQIQAAEGFKQAQILEAEGRLEAAERDAKARERLAEAEATATRLVAEAAQHGQQALAYFTALKSIEAFKGIATSSNSKLVIVPQDSSHVAGAIASLVQVLGASKTGG